MGESGGRAASYQLAEVPAKAVVQEGVEERVEAAVGVTQAGDEVGDSDDERRLREVGGERHHGAQVVGRPAEEAHGQDRHHQERHPLLGALQGLGVAVQPHGMQPAQQGGIEDTDGGHRDGEAQHESVEAARAPPEGLGLREDQHALAPALFVVKPGEDCEGQHDECDEPPHGQAHRARCAVGAAGHSARLGSGQHHQVAVGAHDGEEVEAGEGVVLVDSHDEFAHELPEGPLPQQEVGDVDGQHQCEELIGDGQVEDEQVGDGLHAGRPQQHVQHGGVARQTHGADHRVDNRHSHRQRCRQRLQSRRVGAAQRPARARCVGGPRLRERGVVHLNEGRGAGDSASPTAAPRNSAVPKPGSARTCSRTLASALQAVLWFF
ncbi:hypothetical protein EGK_18947 [Macaca mulatta]|uniref:Uncharacterized protein n=1 Tax=Macaca mulatta TaxID=9544 RepID=G7MZC3_MACMU|nr:hypothetical protein EGK_18947 [Macaca mulatta]